MMTMKSQIPIAMAMSVAVFAAALAFAQNMPNGEPQLVTRHASLVTAEGDVPVALGWKLPPYAKLEGNILTIDVPETAARQGCRVEAEIDLSCYDGVPFEAEIEAWGERIGKPRDAWNGLKFQFEYVDPDTGETQYPNTIPLRGDFERRALPMRDSLCTRKAAPSRLVLGLQDTSGKVVFDLSTLRIREGKPFWPVTNRTHRCAYSAPVGVTSDERRVTSEAAPTLVTRHPSLVTHHASQRHAPLRGVMSPGRNMTTNDFATLADWGVTLLRYQMSRNWGKAGTNRDLAEFEAWLDSRLDHFESFVLPQCRKHGIRVVLDMHVTPGGRNTRREFSMFFEQEYANWFVAKWRRIAGRFKGNADAIYGYDLCNEPVQYAEALPECDWWSIQRRAAEAIREVDPDTPIIIESNIWDVPSTYGTMSPLTLTNVVYEVHVYNPPEYTHQGVGHRDSTLRAYPDSARKWDKEHLKRILKPVRDFEKRHGAKIYVGEFSAIAWAPGADQYLRDCIDIFEEYGWDWTYHAFREWDGWSVEHEADRPFKIVPSADNPRKRALLDGFSRSSTR